ATDLLGPIAASLIGRGLAVLNLVMLLAITPLVAFYLLRDWPKLVTEVDGWLPREHADVIRAQARAIDAVLAGFARGTAIVCATLALYYVLTPNLVGEKVGLHPLWILFALFAGGALLGFAGVVIAVPVAAVI